MGITYQHQLDRCPCVLVSSDIDLSYLARTLFSIGMLRPDDQNSKFKEQDLSIFLSQQSTNTDIHIHIPTLITMNAHARL